MDHALSESRPLRLCHILAPLALCVCCVALNVLPAKLALALELPLYLDSLGTVLAAILGGYLPGIFVGYATNLILSIPDSITAYYATISVLLAVTTTWFSHLGYFRRPLRPKLIIVVLSLAIVGGGLGSVLTWLLYGGGFGEGISAPLAYYLYNNGIGGKFFCQLYADMGLDVLDKAIVVTLGLVLMRLIPRSWTPLLRPRFWRQAPLDDEQRRQTVERTTRLGLRGEIMAMVFAATLLVAAAATGIGVMQYRRTTISEHTREGVGVAQLVASCIDPERVDEYLTRGAAAEGYTETEALLYDILHSLPDMEYLYVYRIESDGCHVVFDLDTAELEGSDPGELVAFDESFSELLPALLAGERIDPLITNDTYGWLLTAYEPVYNAAGECVCYAAVDISMGQLTLDVLNYLVRAVALYLGLFILILSVGMWLAEYSIVLPINSMSRAAGAFAYNTEHERSKSVDALRALDIRTGDEIEALYRALVQTSEENVRAISAVQKQGETIARMQNGLIMVLADMVESRDQCTGDHVRKTAAYVRIIMEQMRRDGMHPDELSDAYINDVVNSAPLHDVGKIQVSDVILNKPGKLSDEEFAIMKTHTTAGGAIIAQAIALVSEPGYLDEARNLATYHHERWDGRGYPQGLKGEEIPLSARVMAVADVFDALVSQRSYKPPFRFEKALDIIREESGTHFDPEVVQAFFDAEDEVRRVAEENAAAEQTQSESRAR